MALRLLFQAFVQPVFFLVFYALFLPALLLAHCWKLVARLLLRVQYGTSVQLMDPCDAISAHRPAPSKEGLIHAVFHVAGAADLAEIRRRVRENLVDARCGGGDGDEDGRLRHPRLRRWIVSRWGLFCWRDVEEFDLVRHVDYHRDPGTGDPVSYASVGDQMAVVQEVIDLPMFGAGVAPWKIFLVPKRDGSETLVVLRSHHCLFDGGAAFMVILPAIADRLEDVDVAGNVKGGNFGAWRFKLLGMLCVPYIFSRHLRSFDVNPLREFSRSKNAPEGKWTYWSEAIPLSHISAIRRKMGVRFSTVLVTVISRAVTRYVQMAEAARNWKRKTTVSAYQAVSMWTPSDGPKLTNKITGISAPMTVGLKKSSLEQLAEVDKSQEFLLRMEFLWGAYTFSNWTSNTFPHFLLETFVVPWLMGGITVFMSSSRGPSSFFAVDGKEVHSLTGIMPLPPSTSLGFVLLSYGDQLGVCLAGRKHAFPELDDLIKLDSLVHEEFNVMFKAASEKGKSDVNIVAEVNV